MAYNYTETGSGTARLKVIMADFKSPDIYEIFYTYYEKEVSGNYSFPDNWTNQQIVGTLTIVTTHYLYVKTKTTKELLATWVQTDHYNYTVVFSGSILSVVPVLSSSSKTGDNISGVSNQISGDYIVHTYGYQADVNGAITGRKLRITNLKSGKVLDFTEADLAITDVSPLSSQDQRWKLLTAIGIFRGED